MDRGAWWATVHGANTSLSLPSGDPYLPDPSCLSTASGLASYLPLLLILFHAAPLSELLSDHSKLKGFFFFFHFLVEILQLSPISLGRYSNLLSQPLTSRQCNICFSFRE